MWKLVGRILALLPYFELALCLKAFDVLFHIGHLEFDESERPYGRR